MVLKSVALTSNLLNHLILRYRRKFPFRGLKVNQQSFLNTPPWSSDRDLQRRFPRLQTFRPFESPDVFGRGAASGDQPDVPVGFSLSFGTQRLPSAMRGSLWPSYAGHCCLDWSDFRKLSMASSCRILPAFDLQSSTMRGFLCRSHPPQLPTAVMKALSGFFTPCN